MKLIRPLFILLIFIQVISLDMRECRAQQPPAPGPIEYELKAVWLYHFGNSMFQWEERANDPFVIAVFGDYPSDLQAQLTRVQRLRIQGRLITIKQANVIQNLRQTQPDILFVTRGNDFSDRVEAAKEAFEEEPVLIVGDFAGKKDEIPISFSVTRNRTLKLWRNDDALPTGVSIHNEDEIWENLRNWEDVEIPPDRTSSTPP